VAPWRSSCSRLQLNDVRLRSDADRRFNSAPPRLKGGLPLILILKTIIHARDAPDRSAGVVQDAVDDMGQDPQSGHPSRGRAPKVVQNPRLKRCLLGIFPALRCGGFQGREHQSV